MLASQLASQLANHASLNSGGHSTGSQIALTHLINTSVQHSLTIFFSIVTQYVGKDCGSTILLINGYTYARTDHGS